MKRLLIVVALTCLTGFLITGCSGPGEQTEDDCSTQFFSAECGSQKGETKENAKKQVKKGKPAWTKLKTFVGKRSGKYIIEVIGYSPSLEQNNDRMTIMESNMSARTMVSMMLNQTVKEYRIKKAEVKEVSTKSTFTGAEVVDRYRDAKGGIYTLMRLELTPVQLKIHKINDVILFLEIAKKRAQNVVRF